MTRLVAPAKLTLSLRVLSRRPDGLHDLDAEMVSVDLADTLEVEAEGEDLVVQEASPGAAAGVSAGADNLVRRALAATGRRAGVRLVKRVPAQGGLGGGSSDAAAILRWAGCSDLKVAASLGADVPFCAVGGRARVRGIGEQVSSLPFEPRSFVLLVPPFGVGTAAAYAAWDALATGPGGPSHDGVNDLTDAALVVAPNLGRWRDLLAEATGRPPVLAGSGSTWFVEGTPAELGIEGREQLHLEGEEGRLIAVRTVPAGWAGD